MYSFWFWQRIVSPHMAGLATALCQQGYAVKYIAEQTISKSRTAQGWSLPDLGKVRLELAPKATRMKRLAKQSPDGVIHICQGIRGNGLISVAQSELTRRGVYQWIIMETVDDVGLIGLAKRFEYKRLFRMHHRHISGVLAIGHRTSDWVVARSVPKERVYPFAYFLPEQKLSTHNNLLKDGPFRILFVGQFIKRKKLDLLIKALALFSTKDIELVVVGAGPLEEILSQQAEATLPGKVKWLGKLKNIEAREVMAKVDCLVLPSRHDGWGAVVSEALMVGTPVICSDQCGSAGVVKASGFGGVFANENLSQLSSLLDKSYTLGKINIGTRSALARWARCLGAHAGSLYLTSIFDHRFGESTRPLPPWEDKS